MSTFFAKKHLEDGNRGWHVIDADGQVLGKVAVTAAKLLRGKNKPSFTPNIDSGDFVVVINAKKVVLTGKKETGKKYMRFSGFVGTEKIESAQQLRARRPERMIELAVRGMIPHNRLGRQIYTKLKVYAGPAHPHEAQQPVAVSL